MLDVLLVLLLKRDLTFPLIYVSSFVCSWCFLVQIVRTSCQLQNKHNFMKMKFGCKSCCHFISANSDYSGRPNYPGNIMINPAEPASFSIWGAPRKFEYSSEGPIFRPKVFLHIILVFCFIYLRGSCSPMVPEVQRKIFIHHCWPFGAC